MYSCIYIYIYIMYVCICCSCTPLHTQDGEDPNVEARCVYTQVNAGMFGEGGALELSRIVFVAQQDYVQPCHY